MLQQAHVGTPRVGNIFNLEILCNAPSACKLRLHSCIFVFLTSFLISTPAEVAR
jgi:hypothetical protein